MQLPARWSAAALFLLPVAASAADPKPPAGEIAHMREELGVNEFTSPSIEVVLQQLTALKPIPFEKVWRDLPDTSPQNRARLALSAGAVIADGFLAVTAEKQSRIEPAGRVLLKLAKGLGVGEHVTKHSRSILEKAARQQWDDIRQELIRTQAEVEAAMLGLKDEELAHLVAMGGWMRGLEITAAVIELDYSPQRAQQLLQPELLDYFIDRLATLNPALSKNPVLETLRKNLAEVKRLTAKPADAELSAEDVKQIHKLAKDANQLIASGAE